MKRSLKIFLIAIFLVIMAVFIACIPENVENFKLARHWFLNVTGDRDWYIHRILDVCSNFLGILLCGICIAGVFLSDRVLRLYKNTEYVIQKKKFREEKQIQKLTEKQKKVEQKLNNLKEDRE